MINFALRTRKPKRCKDIYCRFCYPLYNGNTFLYGDTFNNEGLCSRDFCVYALPNTSYNHPQTPYMMHY
ncbi:MAG: hypothetical protein Q4D21_09575 [Phascolarctobacterium sp.]|nr:hypothetical protein [Phascolarctobacterium sp.]